MSHFTTQGGVAIARSREPVPYANAVERVADRLDRRLGAVFSSNYEYPGRYTRWDTATIDPPLVITGRGRRVTIEALNERGEVPLAAIAHALAGLDALAGTEVSARRIEARVREPDPVLREEERSRQPSVFSILRAVVALFRTDEDHDLALYGAFGYDLAFQFEPVALHQPRDADDRDLVLFLPDELLIVDHHAAEAWRQRYEFEWNGRSTAGLSRDAPDEPFRQTDRVPPRGDHAPGEYAALVRDAKGKFERGDLFEVVPGQTFTERAVQPPSAVSRRLKEINPSPYSFFINLGGNEFLVGASPEMFVRVQGRRVETCPISGTIPRGRDAIEDSAQILKLLNSRKDESELTMCSDVDRNDKSRVCEPGSVRVIGRRQIEMYSRLIHTVDHIEGRLLPGLDAFDAFLSHAWAVTVTGAPKLWAMRFLEERERSARHWYGGAVGMVGFDGNMNTGLTLRTVRIVDGIAEVRAGATLLYDSDPDEEERETELKAAAMLAAIRERPGGNDAGAVRAANRVGEGARVLLVDHEDSFVHTLANYFRQTGAEVTTVRAPVPDAVWREVDPDLLVMSPGPGRPEDFGCAATLDAAAARDLPVFGVCLGLQAIVEHGGGALLQLDRPVHGKPSRIGVTANSMVFSGLEREVTVGRYHSIHADPARVPAGFDVTAQTNGVVMAIEHRTKPIAAVQFHPESIMSLGGEAGQRMIDNVVAHMTRARRRRAA